MRPATRLSNKNFGAGRPMVRVVWLRDGASRRRSQRASAREVSSHAAASPLDRHKREEAEQRGEDQVIARRKAIAGGGNQPCRNQRSEAAEDRHRGAETQRYADRPCFHWEQL